MIMQSISHARALFRVHRVWCFAARVLAAYTRWLVSWRILELEYTVYMASSRVDRYIYSRPMLHTQCRIRHLAIAMRRTMDIRCNQCGLTVLILCSHSTVASTQCCVHVPPDRCSAMWPLAAVSTLPAPASKSTQCYVATVLLCSLYS